MRYLRSLGASSKRTPRLSFLRSEEHTSELQSRLHLVCRLLLEKKKKGRSAATTAVATRPSTPPGYFCTTGCSREYLPPTIPHLLPLLSGAHAHLPGSPQLHVPR